MMIPFRLHQWDRRWMVDTPAPHEIPHALRYRSGLPRCTTFRDDVAVWQPAEVRERHHG